MRGFRFHTTPLIAVVAAIALLLGLGLHLFPQPFTMAAYAPLHPVFPVLSAALITGGAALLSILLSTVARDISEQTRMEEALRESKERFQSAFEHAAIGMALVGLDGRFLQVNRSLSEMLGYSAAELQVTNFQTITHPADLEADLASVQRLLSGEVRSCQMEKRYVHKSGHEIWILLSVSLIRTGDGRPLYFISQIQDISGRKRAEMQLRESYGQLVAEQEKLSALNGRLLADRRLVEQLTERAVSFAQGNLERSANVHGEGVLAQLARALNQMANGLKARLAEREASRRRILDAQETVRRQVAEELHSSVQSKLLVLWYRLGMCLDLVRTDPEQTIQIITVVREQLNSLREHEVRGLSHRLHPSIVRMGFVPALLYLRDQFDGPVAVRLEIDPRLTDESESNQGLPEIVVLTAYRVVEESLSNTVKHADATRVTVRAALHGNSTLLLTVEDDGVGPAADAGQRHGLGMTAMHDLVDALGGTVQLEERVDGGTRVTASIPLAHD